MVKIQLLHVFPKILIIIISVFYSDILFQNISYEKAMGDKFINTCLSLRPHQKSFNSPSPVKLPKLSKNITSFNWIELIDIIKTTYDQLILEEPKVYYQL